MKICSLFLFLILSNYVPAFAQGDFRQGYYITLSNDSIPAYIEYHQGKIAEKECSYRNQKNSETKKFLPGEIAAYGFANGKRYTTRTLPKKQGGQKAFMELVVSGKMSLLKYNYEYYLETDSLAFLEKERAIKKSTSEILTIKPYIGVVNLMMFDCNLSANRIRYAERDLAELVRKYNSCKGSSSVTHKSKIPATILTPQIFAGVDIQDMQLGIDRTTVVKFDRDVSPLIGVSLDMSAPRLYDRILFSVETIFTTKAFEATTEDMNINGYKETHHYTLDASLLKFMASLRYNLFQETHTPYVKFGFSIYKAFSTSFNDHLLKEYPSSNTTIEQDLEHNTKTRTQTGVWGSVGYSMTVSKRIKAFAELRYEEANGFIGPVELNSKSSTQTISIFAGVRF